MTDPIVITREIVKRGWTDFEPKVITGLLTGGAAAFITSLLGQYGIHLDAMSQKILVVAFYFLGSYLTPSSGQTFTRTISKDLGALVQEVESHTGNTVTTVTGATPIQPAVVPAARTFTEAVTGTSEPDPADAATAVYQRSGAAFLNNLHSTSLTSDS